MPLRPPVRFGQKMWKVVNNIRKSYEKNFVGRCAPFFCLLATLLLFAPFGKGANRPRSTKRFWFGFVFSYYLIKLMCKICSYRRWMTTRLLTKWSDSPEGGLETHEKIAFPCEIFGNITDQPFYIIGESFNLVNFFFGEASPGPWRSTSDKVCPSSIT